MRNLLEIIWKFHFFILFLALEVFAGYLIIQNNYFQRASFINSANRVSANVLKMVSFIKEYIYLKSSNEELSIQNAKLLSELSSSFYVNKADLTKITDTIYKQQYMYLATKVISNSLNKRNNYLTLNKGKLHGIQPEMAVISDKGVVGIVKNVTDHYSSVMSVLHKDTKISARIAKNNYFGSLVWNGGNPRLATLLDIPKHVFLKKGDTIVTSSYSSIFPEGIMIGVIDEFVVKPGSDFYTITINLATNFQNITYAYVVNNLLKEELKILEGNKKDD